MGMIRCIAGLPRISKHDLSGFGIHVAWEQLSVRCSSCALLAEIFALAPAVE